MAPQAWVVAENGEDLQRPREFVPLSELEDVGVLYWHLDPKKSESEEELAKIRKDRGYSYMDLIEICPDKLENYEEKVKNFFREHMHPDEEIRYCLEGSGYFDVRDKDDKWIRIWIKEGDMIILPAGIYHRFTLDSAKYTKLMRLFIGVPVWTAFNRPQEDHPARQEYVKNDGKQEVIEAWYMDDSEEDQRLPHHRDPKEFIPLDKLSELGIISWRLNPDNWENDENLKKIREARGYSYMDICDVCPEKLPNYEIKIKNFFEEHLHTDEEIRYCLEGSGYFDVRDENDQWIRVAVKKGGMIVLPAGMYHRFTLDNENYIKAMRLFVGEPVWTPYNRPHDHLPARKEYLDKLLKPEGQAVEAR
ncbi:hypothetical protein BDA96_01G257700 [Sorghum bicolor]|nr:hypothetical protein BDA96_01G257700 [Sorghum bicolor]